MCYVGAVSVSRSEYTKPSGFPSASDNLFEGKWNIDIMRCIHLSVGVSLDFLETCYWIFKNEIWRWHFFDIGHDRIWGIVPQNWWFCVFWNLSDTVVVLYDLRSCWNMKIFIDIQVASVTLSLLNFVGFWGELCQYSIVDLAVFFLKIGSAVGWIYIVSARVFVPL